MSRVPGTPDWERVGVRATELLLEIEEAGHLAERLSADGRSLWPLVRDALFERDGGIIDQAIGSPSSVPTNARSAGALSLRAVAEHFPRSVLGRLRRNRGGILILAQHGRASPGIEPPWDSWTLPFRQALQGMQPLTVVSLSPPTSRFRTFNDLVAIADGHYLPWQAGLRTHELFESRRVRRDMERRLASAWREPRLEEKTRGLDRDHLRLVFIDLARDLALAWLLCRAAERILEATVPTVVLTFDALGNAGKAFAAAARRAGVTSVGVQTGIISPTGLTNLGYRLDLASIDSPRPERLLTWGGFHASILKSFGWPADALSVVGFASEHSGEHSGASGQELLFLATANLGVCSAVAKPSDELLLCASLLAAARRRGLQAVVRCHPAHVGTAYEHALADAAVRSGADFHRPENSIAADLARCSVVAGGASTGLVHSARSGRSLILVGISGLELTGFHRFGTPVITAPRDAEGALEAALAGNSEPARRISEEVAPDLNPAAVRVALRADRER